MYRPSFLHFLPLAFAISACTSKPETPPPQPQPTTSAPTKPAQPEKKLEDASEYEGPVAKVNGVEITQESFELKYNKMSKAFTTRKRPVPDKLKRKYRQSILNELIDRELLNQKLKKEGITVTDEEIASELAEYKAMFRTEENFQRYLKDASGSLDQLIANFKYNVSIRKLLSFQTDIRPSDSEIEAYYKENIARYTVKEQIHASHILLKVDPQGGSLSEKNVKARANEIYDLVTAPGADFAAIAKEKSEGPTASRGGDLGFFGRGKMVAEFENAAFALKPGEISKPVLSQYGWHIIKLIERQDTHTQPLSEVKDNIATIVGSRNQRKAKAVLLKQLHAEANIEILMPKSLLPEEENIVTKAEAEGKDKLEVLEELPK